MKTLRPGAIEAVTDIKFEYSPGRSDKRFTNDRSAFDVFVEYKISNGGLGFIGIEVKYHENLQGPAAAHRPPYDKVAARMGCFKAESLPVLRQAPLQQFWRDHLLAGSMIRNGEPEYAEGVFTVLYPAANTFCRSAVQEYRNCLCDTSTFDAWTLDEFIGILGFVTADPWVEELRGRYLDFSRLNKSSKAV
jgi:hypothetical protein